MNPLDPLSRVTDLALDRTLVGFSQVGLSVRSLLPGWPEDPAPDALVGTHVAVTGATSGLGLATATDCARLGAVVHLVVRDPAKAKEVVAAIQRDVPQSVVEVHRCDVGDLDDVRRFVADLRDHLGETSLGGLVHNAGVMPPERSESAQGHELSMAVHLLGPVLMTELLQPQLSPGARVVMVTSGGMYAQVLRPDDPEYLTGDYSPTTAYARSKRAQVELLPALAARWVDVHLWAMHPGWADTPGVVESLPTFHKVLGPVLRDGSGGADTTVWLLATEPPPPDGGLWHDRRRRPDHFWGSNKPREGAVEQMLAWVLAETGLS
ncbi:hypothetical protein GCM10011519_20890 [Marmoricola endophyticus]|uniref:SDR family NAD(P)-dependent oxidoreductase n=1 Tax=Marmoricola endophyticus TaxID=2040280 RepID=A0A917BIC9_9ACTN|nr:SDR family NAD(P)-dependent oxidoreductase [Marmoricola endophyticus]GGF46720.1 hypothetical protein GCM10011519_20890 [Marmoricola endophyticus]